MVIEKIRVGDEVLAVAVESGFQIVSSRVTAIHYFRSDRLVIIDDDLRTTPSQPLCGADGKYVAAGELRTGAQLLTLESAPHVIRQISLVTGYFGVYSLETDRPPRNYVAAGIVCHNFPKEISG